MVPLSGQSIRCHTNSTPETGEPEGLLWRADDYAADNPNSPRINATILSLVRNNEVNGMIQAMQDLERTWNHKFNYPWTFFNDEPFNAEFKRRTQAETKAKCYYGRLALGAETVRLQSADAIYRNHS